jgi:hypothetical protein
MILGIAGCAACYTAKQSIFVNPVLGLFRIMIKIMVLRIEYVQQRGHINLCYTLVHLSHRSTKHQMHSMPSRSRRFGWFFGNVVSGP